MITRFWLLICWGALAAAASQRVQAQSPAPCPIQLADATAASGITFQHHHGGSGEGYIVEGVVGGLALLDYDDDGFIDVFLLNGAPLKGTVVEVPPRDALYRNAGDGTFVDVTDEAGVGDLGFGLGVTAGDYNNDGDLDLYLNNYGPNVLYRNNGNGTFTDVTRQAGVANGDKVGAGACFLDFDADGDLDLYVGNYVHFTYDNHVPIVVGSERFHAGPRFYEPVPDTLYRNNGDGSFTDVSAASGIGSMAGPSMGLVSADFDDDGDVDVFVCNDESPNFLFQNDGRGNFREVALASGVACDFRGKANGNMGVDCGDIDNDGLLDLFVTTYQAEMPTLFRNLGGGLFEDATSVARISTDLFPHVKWGTGLIDFDNDGDRDLFVACGHFDRIELVDDRTALRVPNSLLLNSGRGRFTDVSRVCGSGLAVVESSRGAAFDDLDNDGDIDGVVLNSNARPTVLRNESEAKNRWLQIRLQGVTTNSHGVGSRVRVVAGDLVQTAEVHDGRGYQGHFGTRLHFGLGNRERVDRIEVRWLGGSVELFSDIATNQTVVLTQGTGTTGR
jgi:hypothetical protein